MKVKALQKGWYNKRIVKEGEVFEFTGKELPKWVEKIGFSDEIPSDKKAENKQSNKADSKDNKTLIEKNKEIANNNKTDETKE
jgi:hypothetical protein